ncbi:MAG: hypothetical protein K0R54_3590 [Clostridiaceae bacterium]|jgi:hypothetical protein|nr:hypothetical protein [Clostridiaceae bacterium]
MRETNEWKRELKKELKEFFKDNSNINPSKFCDIELGLYLWEKINPDENCEDLWVFLVGYHFNTEVFKNLSKELRSYIAKLRFYLKYFKSKQIWKNSLEEYKKIEQICRLYDFDNENKLKRREVTVCSKREDIYEKTLKRALNHSKKDFKWKLNGEISFDYDKFKDSVTIPENWEKITENKKSIINLKNNRQKSPITIKLSGLIETAKWMDNKLKSGDWENRIKRIAILIPNWEDELEPSNKFTLDGIFNLVGMVSSGKSTLMQILAVWAAKNNYHITLIVDSVVAVMNLVQLMEKLELDSSPILGKHNRDNQLKKLHFAKGNQNFNELVNESIFKWVSTICPLNGLRKDTTKNKPFKPGEEPCNKLYLEEKVYYYCPMYYSCPIHKSWNEIYKSRVIVTTPASLIYTHVPIQNSRENIRVLELVYNLSDIIVFDEVDRVQLQMDGCFSPAQVLADGKDKAWLNTLGNKVGDVFYRSGRRQLREQNLENWFEAHKNVQNAVNSLYNILITKEKMRNWAAKDHFSAQWLIIKFVESLKDKDNKNIQNNLFNFRKDPMGVENDSVLCEAWSNISVSPKSNIGYKKIKEWCIEFHINEEEVEDLYDKLEIIVVTAVLENNLKILIDEWDEAENAFQLSTEELTFFKNYLRDYSTIIPESPMGNYFGFMFEEGKNEEMGKLQVFRFMGIGRYILTNFSTLFEDLDGEKGPHTLLLSGTSWAPKSASYHIQLPVNAVLKAPDSEFAAIEKSQFIFKPAYYENEPIIVSGESDKNKRLKNLKRIVDYITEEGTSVFDNFSILDKEINMLQKEKKQLLMLTGSYEEAKVVQKYLIEKMKNKTYWKKEDIYRLESDGESFEDSDEPYIRRSIVNNFASKKAKILIAPLLAMERGHNILNKDNVALLGSAFFLVRPMPIPNDMNNNTVYINNWALDKFSNTKWINVLGKNPTVGMIGNEFRKKCEEIWRLKMYKMINHYGGTKSMDKDNLKELYWTQLVLIWQVIGRLIRGGQSARVYFMDAAFAIEIAKGSGNERFNNSMLLGIKEVLDPYFDEDEIETNTINKNLAMALYGPFYKAISNIRGMG